MGQGASRAGAVVAWKSHSDAAPDTAGAAAASGGDAALIAGIDLEAGIPCGLFGERLPGGDTRYPASPLSFFGERFNPMCHNSHCGCPGLNVGARGCPKEQHSRGERAERPEEIRGTQRAMGGKLFGPMETIA